MKHRRLDSNWDYCFGRGTNDYLSNLEAVAQAIKTHLLLLYGEWWEDTKAGLPLFQKIAGVRGTEENLQAIDLIFKERILDTTGVVSVLGYESSYENRRYSFTATVETLYGTLVISNTKEAAT